MKWGYFLNEPGRAAPWKQVHALYLLADHDAYAQAPFVLYPSQPSFKPSVQSLYLRTLLLDLLNSGNLSKIQIEIADGWLSSWCNDYALDAEYSSRQHLFCVDVASDSGMHLMRRDSHGEGMRYMRADNLKAQIEEVQAGLRHGHLLRRLRRGRGLPGRAARGAARDHREALRLDRRRAARTASRSAPISRTARSTLPWAWSA